MAAGDGEQLSFPDDCFEVAVSVDALEWTSDLFAFLRESARVCKPDGRAVAVHTD